MKDKIRVAVIGCGKLGSLHAKIYSRINGVDLVSVCDTNRHAAKKTAKECGSSHCADYRELLGKTDAVSIAVPTSLHYKVARDFLADGSHALIEKPITTTTAEADELLRLARSNNLILSVGHLERFNSAIEASKKLKGDIKFVECHRLGTFTLRCIDVGVVLDLMIHDIDIILGLIRSEVTAIEAVGVKILTQHEDIANARIKFKNGAICNLTASRVSTKPLRKIRIFQPGAYFSIDYITQEAVLYRKIGRIIIPRKINIHKQKPLQKELTSFVECIKNNRQPLVSGEEAREALRIALEITDQIQAANPF